MVKCRIKTATAGPTARSPGEENGRYGRANARATETDTGNPAFLGRHAGRRAAPAALRCLRQCLFPAATVLPGLRIAQGQHVQSQRQGDALQLRHQPSPSRARFHAALRDCRGGIGRRPADDEQHHRLSPDAGGARTRHKARSHVRNAAAAIEAGLCKTVLITHAESGKSMIGKQPRSTPADSLNGQFEAPFGVYGPPSMFPIPVLRYMKTHGITHEQIAMVAVVQREWAAKNPRATMKAPITVEDVLNSRMIAYPFRILQCCLVTDGGGALILTSADRAKDFKTKPVYVLGTGESVETPMVSQMQTFDSSRAFQVAGPLAFKEAGITHADVDHLMIYDAFAHLPLYGLGDLGFMPHEETGKFIADGNTRPGGKLPLNTNCGGLSYIHSGMYGIYALQESVRQMRGIAPAQVPGAKISVCHGVGGMFAASGTIIFTNQS